MSRSDVTDYFAKRSGSSGRPAPPPPMLAALLAVLAALLAVLLAAGAACGVPASLNASSWRPTGVDSAAAA